MKNREQEIKAILSQNEYDYLKKKLQFDEEFEQINIYYSDKNGILDNRKITVRIREKRGTLILQVKEPISEKGSLHVHNEYEKVISDIPRIICSEELSELCGIYLPDVQLLDFLITHRAVKWWNKTTQICLDKSIYLGKVDYEVEIEYEQRLHENVIAQFGNWNIQFNKDVCGKYQRFKKEYKKQQGL